MNSYECWVVGYPEHKTTVNSITSGKAKAEYFRKVKEPLCDLLFTEVRCRKIGGPHTSDEFMRVAENRGVPKARCGMKVEVEDRKGIIVGHNYCGNFDVFFFDAKNVGNCHPGWEMKYFDGDGKLVYDTCEAKR